MKIWLISLILTSTYSFAGILPEKLEDTLVCKKEIIKIVSKIGVKEEWIRIAESHEGTFIFRAPTKKFGSWVEIHSGPHPMLLTFSNKKTRRQVWQKDSCKVKELKDLAPLKFLTRKAKNSFRDQELSKLINSKKPTLIYIWSPSMIYSFRQMKDFITAAKETGVNFLPLHDNEEPIKFVKAALKHAKLNINTRPMVSLELIMRGADLHYPASFVVGKGKISEKIFGVKPVDFLVDDIKEILLKFKQSERRER